VMPARAASPARSLRARVQASIVGVTALAVMLFAVPLAIAMHSIYDSAAVTSLQRDATQVAAMVPETIATEGGSVRLPWDLPGDLTVGVYTTKGMLIRERGPVTSALAAQAHDGRGHVAVEGADLAVSAPVPADRGVTATVRVAIPHNVVMDRTLGAWVVMAVLGACVIGIAALMARRQAGRIALPLERLTESARALGAGDFAVSTERSRIVEADTLAEAIESTARRLGELVQRERAFSTHVSHQLRTPLTALLLGLESALSVPGADMHAAARVAVRRGEQLETTIEGVLRLARDTHPRRAPLVVPELLDDVRDYWQGAFVQRHRELRVSALAGLPEVRVSAVAVRHIVDVLVDNALVHGAGDADVTVSMLADGLLIEVSDEGPGLTDPEAAFTPRTARTGTHGIGLGLARSLAEAEGGRLLLRRVAPHPVFGLLLPTSAPHQD
jgi:signal transduction histidine kinase